MPNKTDETPSHTPHTVSNKTIQNITTLVSITGIMAAINAGTKPATNIENNTDDSHITVVDKTPAQPARSIEYDKAEVARFFSAFNNLCSHTEKLGTHVKRVKPNKHEVHIHTARGRTNSGNFTITYQYTIDPTKKTYISGPFGGYVDGVNVGPTIVTITEANGSKLIISGSDDEIKAWVGRNATMRTRPTAHLEVHNLTGDEKTPGDYLRVGRAYGKNMLQLENAMNRFDEPLIKQIQEKERAEAAKRKAERDRARKKVEELDKMGK